MVNLPIIYTDKKVTPFGGMSLMKRFMDKLDIGSQLSQLPLPISGSNRGYQSKDIVHSFFLNVWTGASRYVHCNWLRGDAVLKEIFGFKDIPSQSTYSRFFNKFSQKKNTEVFPKLQKWLFDKINIGSMTIDFDSTVITRSGKQEGAAKGYNPNKLGRNSHHPLMAFIEQTRMVANAWLRPGNTSASSNCEAFMEETFEEVLKDQKIGLVRADSGFYTSDLLEYLERKTLNYIIAVRMYPNLKGELYGLKDWVSLAKGIELNELTFKHINGKPRRYIVIRKQIEDRVHATGKLLFDDQPMFRYSCYVTNMELPLNEIWNMYNRRADCENRIKELKQDFGLDNFCMQDFWATEASFRFIIIAYNLISMFRHFALNQHRTATLSTLKSYCFALGAWTTKHANSKALKIALPVKKRPWMNQIFDSIDRIDPDIQFSYA